VAAAAALILTGGYVVLLGATQHGSPATAPLPVATSTSSMSGSDPAPSAAEHQSRLNAPLPGPAPTSTAIQAPQVQRGLAANSIRIPSLGVTATIGLASLINGVLTPPRVPTEVGAWAGSAPLTGTTGEVTLAGHVNWVGMGEFAFAKLASLHAGDLIYTADKGGQQTAWRVTAVTARSKSSGVDPAAFAGAHGPRTLTLITCGGTFDTDDESYDHNIYVTAQPATTD
jgi:sortase (surface protein transpeptidase)